MLSLHDLEIYRLANEIGDDVWKIVNAWLPFQKDTIGKQFVRAADSISLNIAEGYGKFHYKENKNFCYYSRGSAYETKDCLKKSVNRKLIAEIKNEQLLNKLDLFLKKLNAYINTIGRLEQQVNSSSNKK